MSRYISLITLLVVIAIVIVAFYKVMASFCVPLFLAALLVVIFKPFHVWFLKVCKGNQKLAAFSTTGAILLAVLIPLLALFVLAAFESQQLLRSVNKKSLIENVELTRKKLNLELPPVTEELTAIDDQLENMFELEQFEDVVYWSADQISNVEIYNEVIGSLVNEEFSNSESVQQTWNAYQDELASLKQLQADLAAPSTDSDGEDLEPGSADGLQNQLPDEPNDYDFIPKLTTKADSDRKNGEPNPSAESSDPLKIQPPDPAPLDDGPLSEGAA